jgi:hypothetical protein
VALGAGRMVEDISLLERALNGRVG